MRKEPITPTMLEFWLPPALNKYEEEFFPSDVNFAYDKESRFKRIKGKTYRSRMIVPVKKAGEEVGKLYVLAFAYGDGTGDEEDYKLEGLFIPGHLSRPEFMEKQSGKLVPRKKDGVVVEACFPFFSFYNEIALWNTVSLEELTVDNYDKPTEIITFGHLGKRQEEYAAAIEGFNAASPRIFLTTGHVGEGKMPINFGNPHSVVYSAQTEARPIQVVGFLAVKDEKNPLHDILYKHGQLPELPPLDE